VLVGLLPYQKVLLFKCCQELPPDSRSPFVDDNVHKEQGDIARQSCNQIKATDYTDFIDRKNYYRRSSLVIHRG